MNTKAANTFTINNTEYFIPQMKTGQNANLFRPTENGGSDWFAQIDTRIKPGTKTSRQYRARYTGAGFNRPAKLTGDDILLGEWTTRAKAVADAVEFAAQVETSGL